MDLRFPNDENVVSFSWMRFRQSSFRLLRGLASPGDECFDFGQIPSTQSSKLEACRDKSTVGVAKYGPPTVAQYLAHCFDVAEAPRCSINLRVFSHMSHSIR
jgi:hypothetical protein